MPKDFDMKIRNTGRRTKLLVYHKGKWHAITLQSRKEANTVAKPKMVTTRINKLMEMKSNMPEVIMGGPAWQGQTGSAIPISLKTDITICKTTPGSEYYTLGVGFAGQKKLIIHKSYKNTECYIKCNTALKDDQIFTSVVAGATDERNGKIIELVSDGVVWYPYGGYLDSNDATYYPGTWDIS